MTHGILPGQWVQNVDHPAHVQALSEPAWRRRPRVNVKRLRVVPRSNGVDGIRGHCSSRRDCRHESAVRVPEAELSIGLSFHLILVFRGRSAAPILTS